MVAIARRNCTCRPASPPAWHAKFLAMLPAIVLHARIAFRHCNPEAKQEAVQGVVCNACQAVARLAKLGKLDLAYPTVLARYGAAQVREGRKVGAKLNCQDVLSPYCQRLKNLTVERLDQFDDEENAWKETAVQDSRTAPVSETVAFRCDFHDWLKCLSPRDGHLAQTLAGGSRTHDVAKRFQVSDGRVSQLRRELAESWRRFADDDPDDGAAVPV